MGTGNEAASAGHTSGVLQKRKEERIQLAVQADEPTLNIQIWKAYTDEVEISFVSPAGTRIGPIQSVPRFAEIPDRGNGDFIILWKTEPV